MDDRPELALDITREGVATCWMNTIGQRVLLLDEHPAHNSNIIFIVTSSFCHVMPMQAYRQ